MAISEMLLFAKKENLYVRLQIQVVHIKVLKMPLKKTNKGRRDKNAEIMKKELNGGKKQNKTITHMNFQYHSCLLPQRTSDIRNLEERSGYG